MRLIAACLAATLLVAVVCDAGVRVRTVYNGNMSSEAAVTADVQATPDTVTSSTTTSTVVSGGSAGATARRSSGGSAGRATRQKHVHKHRGGSNGSTTRVKTTVQ